MCMHMHVSAHTQKACILHWYHFYIYWYLLKSMCPHQSFWLKSNMAGFILAVSSLIVFVTPFPNSKSCWFPLILNIHAQISPSPAAAVMQPYPDTSTSPGFWYNTPDPPAMWRPPRHTWALTPLARSLTSYLTLPIYWLVFRTNWIVQEGKEEGKHF